LKYRWLPFEAYTNFSSLKKHLKGVLESFGEKCHINFHEYLYTGILVMLGPFSVALSVLPMFKNSFSTWGSKFISVNLYLGIAYIVMFIGGILQDFAMQAEINKYRELVDLSGGVVDMTKLLYLKTSGLLSFGTAIISFLVSAVGILTVPSISTWIVSTSGATSAW